MINTSFLLPSDYDPQVRKDILKIITDDTDGLRSQAEKAAIAQVKTILAYRHNVDCIFPVILPYHEGFPYSEADNVVYMDYLYVALKEGVSSKPPECYDETKDYLENDLIIFYQTTYKAKQDAPAGSLPTDTSFYEVVPDPDWGLSTSRNPYLIMILVDIVLYHLHSRISPNNIPKIRMDRYDEAMSWLKQVSKGEASLSECLKTDEEGEEIKSIPWGSKSRNDNCW